MSEEEKSYVRYYPDRHEKQATDPDKTHFVYIHCSCSTKGCGSHWDVRLVIRQNSTTLPENCFRCRKCGNDSPWKSNHAYLDYL